MLPEKKPGGWLRWCMGAGRDVGNRRSSRRFAATSGPATIGWFRSGRFVTASVALRDVSLAGLSAISDETFPRLSVVWLSLNNQPEGRWVKAVVVDVKVIRRQLVYRKGPYLVRLRYGLGCPYTFFRAAVGGPEPGQAGDGGPTPKTVPPGSSFPTFPTSPAVDGERSAGATHSPTRPS